MDEADRPRIGEEGPPWETLPELRRDLAPHRGHLLRSWSVATTVLSVLSMWALFPAVVAIPLALLLWWAATHDLRKMRAGEMDPRGEEQAAAARTDARVALIFPAIGFLMLGAWLVLMAIDHP
jgi:hypothetical protein